MFNTCYCPTLWNRTTPHLFVYEPRNHHFNMTIGESRPIAIARIICSLLSCISSTTIVIIITRSSKKLTTTQNRLVFGMSCSDILSSLSMLFAPISMPRETPDAWLALGNITTCEVQAFVLTLGSTLAPCYNAALCIYFFLKIRHDVRDDIIAKKVEPFLHLVPITMIVAISIYSLCMSFFNPLDTLCYLATDPFGCSITSDMECERGEGVYQSVPVILLLATVLLIVPLIIISTMAIICWTVYKQEQRMETYGRGSLTLSTPNNVRRREGLSQYCRKTMYRALAYSTAWLVTFIFPTIIFINRLSNRTPSFPLQMLAAIFHSLQGCSNFAVFVYPKVANIRQMNPETSIFKALFIAMKSNT